MGSVREDPIVLDEVRIAAPVIRVEVLKNGSTNIDALRQRIEAYRSQAGESNAKQKNLRIRKFTLEKAQVEVDLSALGEERRTLTLRRSA